MKVFVGGSISINDFGLEASILLEDFMSEYMDVLVGDANGVDADVQEYLMSSYYGLVTVYACNGKARNNIGSWEVKTINVPAGLHGRKYYEQKDIAMTNDCDFGLMIWDGKSKGTLNNIKRLIDAGKQCYVCLPHLKERHSLRWNSDLQNLINRNNQRGSL